MLKELEDALVLVGQQSAEFQRQVLVAVVSVFRTLAPLHEPTAIETQDGTKNGARQRSKNAIVHK